MSAQALAGKVLTVLGPIDADLLGITMPHEHVMKDSSDRFPAPIEVSKRPAFYQELTLQNLHRVTYGNFFDVLDNTRLTDEEVAVSELQIYRNAGGATICDLTCGGMNGDPLALARISRASGVNIVLGCGYYLGRFHPPEVARMSEDDVAEQLIDEISRGIGATGVRAGILGEIGCSWPVQTEERKVLRAAVRAQRATGAGLSIHPSPNECSPTEILEILIETGATLDRTVICHMDRCGYPLETRLRLLEAGCFIEYDTFGYHVHPIGAAVREGALPSMLNDVARVMQIVELVELGFITQLLVSHDIAFKHALTRWGGQGYGHIVSNVTPYMNLYGLTSEQVDELLVKNPRRLLEIA